LSFEKDDSQKMQIVTVDLARRPSPAYWGGPMLSAPGGRRVRATGLGCLEDEISREARRWWKDRPIYIFWGDKDNDLIIMNSPGHAAEGPSALMLLQRLGCQNVKHEIIKGGGHDTRPELAAQWFAAEVAKKPEKVKKRRPAAQKKAPTPDE
jgi:hypothetical protein